MTRQEALQWLVENVAEWPSQDNLPSNGCSDTSVSGWRFVVTLGTTQMVVFGNCVCPGITQEEWDKACDTTLKQETLQWLVDNMLNVTDEVEFHVVDQQEWLDALHVATSASNQYKEDLKWAVDNVLTWPDHEDDMFEPIQIAPGFVTLVSKPLSTGQQYVVKGSADDGYEVVLANGHGRPITKNEWIAAQALNTPELDMVTLIVDAEQVGNTLTHNKVQVNVPLSQLQQIVADATA